LNRIAVGLNLPTVIMGPVVLNGEFDVHEKESSGV
jgi:hypothetical protein